MIARHCLDPHHEGDPYIQHPYDAFEIRLEARRLHDQAGRSYRQLLSPVCRDCRDRWLNKPERAPRDQVELWGVTS